MPPLSTYVFMGALQAFSRSFSCCLRVCVEPLGLPLYKSLREGPSGDFPLGGGFRHLPVYACLRGLLAISLWGALGRFHLYACMCEGPSGDFPLGGLRASSPLCMFICGGLPAIFPWAAFGRFPSPRVFVSVGMCGHVPAASVHLCILCMYMYT